MTAITLEPHSAPGHPGRPPGPVGDRRSAGDQPADQTTRSLRSWPLLVLAAPAAAEVWSGWVGVARMTGFGMVSPLPGIWPALRLDTSITLPVGVECYAALALRAWLASGQAVSGRTRRFAKWSALCSFLLGMAGQVASHLMQQAGLTRAPWAVTMLVSCLPVLVLAMGTALAHLLREDAADAARSPTAGQAAQLPPQDQQDRSRTSRRTDQDQRGAPARDQPAAGPRTPRALPTRPAAPTGGTQAQATAMCLASGKLTSRRALRAAGAKGSNEALNRLAREINAELANATQGPA